ncbi:uncharacterized protein PSFLO_03571 [Pseudozyma flocculosa]|uniref:Uncharacterized protein n=1 Tax=Pseudozyma flocculosa TaxID=84751 RepID=A0A5C3F0Q1_9BASI|nr:uncharacterized protein PSFLO_03571 [Pseudozyma flocculosa]
MSNESPGATTGDGRIGYSDFEAGCLAYLGQRSAAAAAAPEAVPGSDGDAEGQRLGAELYAGGWSWCSGARNRSVYHAAPPRGGLVRSAELAVHLDISPLVSPAGGDEDLLGAGGWLDAVDDEATVKPSPRMRVPVRLHQTIAWSSTWRVPVLYFQATTMEGRPLSLDELTSSSLLHGFGTLDSALHGERSRAASLH